MLHEIDTILQPLDPPTNSDIEEESFSRPAIVFALVAKNTRVASSSNDDGDVDTHDVTNIVSEIAITDDGDKDGGDVSDSSEKNGDMQEDDEGDVDGDSDKETPVDILAVGGDGVSDEGAELDIEQEVAGNVEQTEEAKNERDDSSKDDINVVVESAPDMNEGIEGDIKEIEGESIKKARKKKWRGPKKRGDELPHALTLPHDPVFAQEEPI